MNEDNAVWIRTEPSVDGSTYIVTVSFGSDHAITLTPERAQRYAWTVLAAAQRAEYDGAVFRQLRQGLGLEAVVAGQMIHDLRNDRPPLDHEATAPLRLEPGVTVKGKPFLALWIEDEQVGQWDLEQARAHGPFVMEAVEAANLDAGYYRALTSIIQVDKSTARNVIDALGGYRQEKIQ